MSQSWWPIPLVLGIVVATDLMLINQSAALTVPVAFLATALLVYVALRAGLSWTDLGLGRASTSRGLIWGAAAFALVTAGYVLVVLSPWGGQVLADDRTPQEPAALLLKVLVVIPLRTIVLEEVAFRGVLWGLLRDRFSTRTATLGSAAAFGLWHIPPAFLLLGTNTNLAEASEGSILAVAAVVLAIVVSTGLAGVLLAELRRRTGSLWAPIGLHAGTNIVGTLASYLM